MGLKRLLFGLAALCAFAVMVGFGSFHVGSIEVSLLGAGLFCYFLGEFA